MKQFLFSYLFLITLSVFGQNPPINIQPQHFISIGLGGFGQGGTTGDYFGATTCIAYQVLFPHRFIFGVEVKTDQSLLPRIEASNPYYETTSRLSGYSFGFHLGRNVVRNEKIDFSLFLIPHINFQEYLKTNLNKEIGEKLINRSSAVFIFNPLLFFRGEIYYRFNEFHNFGLLADANVEFELGGLGDILSAEIAGLGRLLISYRYTFSFKN